MKFPTFTDQKFVEQDGSLTPHMQDYMDLQAQSLQAGLSDNGWTFPLITASNLTKIAPKMPNGTMWVVSDSTPQVLVIKRDNSLFKIDTSTPYP